LLWKFLAVKTFLAMQCKIYEIMWMEHKAVYTVVLMPGATGDYIILDFYSGIPYKNGNCENKITLFDEWNIENNSAFSENTNLYPSKIQNNFQKCVFKAASIGFQHFVNLFSAETKEEDKILYETKRVDS
jgi:hypothetical protein